MSNILKKKCVVCGKTLVSTQQRYCSRKCRTRAAYFRNFKREQNFKLKVMKTIDSQVKCACCGETHIEFLSIDHIHGEGKKYNFRHCSSSRIFKNWIIKKWKFGGPALQILCFNCNRKKAWDHYFLRNFYGSMPLQHRRFCSIHHPELYPELKLIEDLLNKWDNNGKNSRINKRV